MDLLAALLQGASFLAFAAALCRPAAGRLAAGIGVAAALFCVAYGIGGPTERELVCTHGVVAYEGMALEPALVHVPTETVRAAGVLWPLPYAAFALVWSALLWRRRTFRSPWLLPLLLGWSALAAWLCMQKLAAPAEVVQPAGLERFLWPAGLAMALRLAAQAPRFLPLLLQIAIGTAALRLPAALFSKLASDQHLGTGLDVSAIVDIVHPITRQQFQPRLESGSFEQQFWLIWAEHVLVIPAFHLMSFAGIAFAVWLMHKHADTPP